MNTPHTPPAVSESRHTPEPWTESQGTFGQAIVRDTQSRVVASTAGNSHTNDNRNGSPYRIDTAEANAKRICACVNACAGMADPAAEIAALKDAAQCEQKLRNEIASLRAQRDELLKALEHLEAELHKALDDVPAGVDAWMANARIAIANATRQ